MVAFETVIGGFVIVFMLLLMGVMGYLALGTQNDDTDRSGPDEEAAETAE